MKISASSTPAKFSPVKLSVTFESQSELDAFATMLNCTPITDNLPFDTLPITQALTAEGAEIHSGVNSFVHKIAKHPACR